MAQFVAGEGLGKEGGRERLTRERLWLEFEMAGNQIYKKMEVSVRDRGTSLHIWQTNGPSQDKQCFEIQKKQFLIENDRLLDQIIYQDIVNIVVNSSLDMNTYVNVNSSVAMNDSVNYVEMCNKCLELKAELIKQHNMVEKDEYNRL
ncbi:hypothetical protein Tco_0018848 [Tanacetum coccineum]